MKCYSTSLRGERKKEGPNRINAGGWNTGCRRHPRPPYSIHSLTACHTVDKHFNYRDEVETVGVGWGQDRTEGALHCVDIHIHDLRPQ